MNLLLELTLGTGEVLKGHLFWFYHKPLCREQLCSVSFPHQLQISCTAARMSGLSQATETI